jgi:death-on-curing protein
LDLGGLESAAHNPRMAFYFGGEDDVIVLAVSLFLAINRNHPFLQGNKRTAWLSALQLLEINGYVTPMPDHDKLGEFLTGVATGTIAREFLEYYLWRFSTPVT